MIKLADAENCTGCGACVSICPQKCIKMTIDVNGFYMPLISKDCVQCGLCVKKCHVLSEHRISHSPLGIYAMWDKDERKRFQGSSGGVFGRLAEFVLANNGVVYGAAFNENRRTLSHKSTDEVSLDLLKKSKYVESYMGDTIARVFKDLKANRQVLFCGTPCQVMGARSVFGDKYSNLILCDFLCHGVPSLLSYNKYLDYIEQMHNKKVADISFRSKIYGWKVYAMNIKFEDGSSYIKMAKEDSYFRLFFSSMSNRPSCMSCDRDVNSQADITLGDYWGARKQGFVKDDDKGISLVLVHTDKGKIAVETIMGDLNFTELPHSSLLSSVYRKRTHVYKDYVYVPRECKLSVVEKLKNILMKYSVFRRLFYRFF